MATNPDLGRHPPMGKAKLLAIWIAEPYFSAGYSSAMNTIFAGGRVWLLSLPVASVVRSVHPVPAII